MGLLRRTKRIFRVNKPSTMTTPRLRNIIDLSYWNSTEKKAFHSWGSPGYLVWVSCTWFAHTVETFHIVGWETLEQESNWLVPVWKNLSLLCRIIQHFHSFDLVFYQRFLLFVIKTKCIWIRNLSLWIYLNEETCNTSEIITLSIPVKYKSISRKEIPVSKYLFCVKRNTAQK